MQCAESHTLNPLSAVATSVAVSLLRHFQATEQGGGCVHLWGASFRLACYNGFAIFFGNELSLDA